MAMTINGETVYIPSRKDELILGLERMGVYKIAGLPLARITVKELVHEYCRTRAADIRRKQQSAVRRNQITQMSLFTD